MLRNRLLWCSALPILLIAVASWSFSFALQAGWLRRSLSARLTATFGRPVEVAHFGGHDRQHFLDKVVSVGGRFTYTDNGETPNTQVCVFDYGDAELIFEVRGRTTKPYQGAMVGNVIHCTDGHLVFCTFNSGGRILTPGSPATVAAAAPQCRLDIRQGPDHALYYSDTSGIYRLG